MTLARTEHNTNIVLGAGEIYFDRQDADGNYTGERYLGDSVGATLSLATERTTIQSGDGAVAQDLVDIVRSVSRTMGFTLRDSSIANWALFLIGDEETETIAADAAIAEHSLGALKVGRWAQVGRTSTRPNGVGAINKTGFVAKDGNTAIAANTIHYSDESGDPGADDKLLVDLKTGRVQALSADIGNLKVACTAVGRKISRAKATADARRLEGALRYLEDDPTAGKGRSVYVRKCNLAPGGEAALKSRDTEQQLAFTASVQDPTDDGDNKYPAISIDGEEL